MEDFAGKTVFVTGGAGGIGLGIARAFAERGAKLALADIDAGRLTDAVANVAAIGGTAIPVSLNIADAAQWESAVAQVEATLGPIDVLCNNAAINGSGGTGMARLVDADPKFWTFLVEVNIFGTFHGCRTVLPRMLAREYRCHIVNTASLSGLVPDPGLSAYCASKYAVVGLSDVLRLELAGSNVGISVLYPGLTRTDGTANSASAVERLLGTRPPTSSGMASMLKGGMEPDFVGRQVVAAIEAGDYHIFSHVDWKQIVSDHFADRMAAFGIGADPDFKADLAGLKAMLKS